MQKVIISFISFLFFALPSKGQFVNSIQDTNFSSLESNFFQSYSSGVDTGLDNLYAQFMRFSSEWKSRISLSSGYKESFKAFSEISDSLNQLNNSAFNRSVQSLGAWQSIGPGQNGLSGVGRVNCITFDLWDPANIIYIGTAAGGVWKSTNGGDSWQVLNTDLQLARLGISDIVLDPTSPNHQQPIIYVATGDFDGGKYFSDGIYRSEDGGSTWFSINNGLFGSASLNLVSKILLDPVNSNIAYTTTSAGIYKSINRQSTNVTWSKIYPLVGEQSFSSIDFQTGSTSLIASGIDIIKTTDEGQNWFPIATPGSGLDLTHTPTAMQWPGNYVLRIKSQIPSSITNDAMYSLICVSNAFPPLYNSTYYYYFYKYIFSTGTWIKLNYFVETANGLLRPTTGRMAFAVSTVDQNDIYAGNVILYNTEQGGMDPIWDMTNGCQHVDYHDIKFQPGTNDNVYFCATDGGMYKTTRSPELCDEKNNGLVIAQINGLSSAVDDPDQLLIGLFDNGMRFLKNGAWSRPNQLLNDIFETVTDKGDSKKMLGTGYGYCSAGNGCLHRSQAANPNFSCCYNNESQDALFDAPQNLCIDPKISGIVYQGRRPDIFKSVDFGQNNQTWTRISDFVTNNGMNGIQSVTALAISPSNPNYIYTALTNGGGISEAHLLMTMSGGTGGWTDITPNINSGNWINSIVVSDKDPSHIWIGYSGYDSNLKVKEYLNGNWIDKNQGLPNTPVNCLVYERGANDAVYAGTDIGVYYINKTMNAWTPYMGSTVSNGLPNVIVNNLEINYTNNKIRAGTFGRGVWESDLFCPEIDDLNLSGFNTNTIFQEARLNIFSTESIVFGNVVYRAGASIELNPGFEMNTPITNTSLYAYIHPCDAYGNSFRIRRPLHNSEVSVEDKSLIKQDIFIYPNPSSGIMNVKLEDFIDELILVQIFNMLNDLVLSIEFQLSNENELTLDLSNLPNGLYFIKTKTSIHTNVNKVIINQ